MILPRGSLEISNGVLPGNCPIISHETIQEVSPVFCFAETFGGFSWSSSRDLSRSSFWNFTRSFSRDLEQI